MAINYAPCPKCSGTSAQKLSFTWWGGVLGPKLLTHVKCLACGYKYNGKTGKDNTTNIVIYSVIVSCRRRGIDPWEYLSDVLERLPAMNQSQIPSVLPARWQPASPKLAS